jgi:hypothetical protein
LCLSSIFEAPAFVAGFNDFTVVCKHIRSAASLGRNLLGAGENIDTKPHPKMQQIDEDPIFT